MATIKIPYFQWRSGRPRWEPGPGLRALGLTGRDLKDRDGGWLEEADAIARARELNAEANNVASAPLTVALAPYAQLAVSVVSARSSTAST